ncbi:transcription elongation factor GreA [Methylophilaceae bacterium]|jgi:transcription elongation factor GreA|nr:transcription elongation factor GreA [Nitrosomonadales bacterium]MDA9085961.1 transcription elongation factor GreA [Methylophilaceae bacterium]MBT5410876.1 transcription elongation factor GreA [Nitrosomonadales bacterium]MBT6141460.1 transcription elongation factor GreA [Nitrosomonadales bacterium]MDA9087506.1 transcription elongation factor GreA [Methylophilaceae bacterium]|tara:strand:+ start:6217 stop:6693 length:477 start_codon:yes stop_codon:yes gene_type:complete
MAQIHMTRNGLEALKKELQQLKSVDRPAIIEAIAEARAQGDLSENAEYESAKEKQGFIEGRLADIEAKISQAEVIDPANLKAEGRCVFGATIELEDLDTEKKSTYQIVGDDESSIKDNKISINSPLAKALIGKEAGDVVEFESPGGIKSFDILRVLYI